MKQLAALPLVYCKISMLGYGVPGWHSDGVKHKFVQQLVLEVIQMFGAQRCMFASNYHINAAVSDSDGLLHGGPTVSMKDIKEVA